MTARWWAALVALVAGLALFVTSLPLVWDRYTNSSGVGVSRETYTGMNQYLDLPSSLGSLLRRPELGSSFAVYVLLPALLGVAALLLGGAAQAAVRVAAIGLAAAQLGTVLPYLADVYGPVEVYSGDTFTDRPGPGGWFALAGLVLLLAAALLVPRGGVLAGRRRPPGRPAGPMAGPADPTRVGPVGPVTAGRTRRQRRLVALGVAGWVALTAALAVPWYGRMTSAVDLPRYLPETYWTGVFRIVPVLHVIPHLRGGTWFVSEALVLVMLGVASGVAAAVTARSTVAAPALRILSGLGALFLLGTLGYALVPGTGAGTVTDTVHLLGLLISNPGHEELKAPFLGLYLAVAGLLMILVFAVVPPYSLSVYTRGTLSA